MNLLKIMSDRRERRYEEWRYMTQNNYPRERAKVIKRIIHTYLKELETSPMAGTSSDQYIPITKQDLLRMWKEADRILEDV